MIKADLRGGRLVLLGLSVILFLISAGARAGDWQLTKIGDIDGFDVPESVCPILGSKDVYVSNVDSGKGSYWADDGKGYISLLVAPGEIKNIRWLDSTSTAPLNAPKGMCVLNDYLYFTDNTGPVADPRISCNGTYARIMQEMPGNKA